MAQNSGLEIIDYLTKLWASSIEYQFSWYDLISYLRVKACY